MKDENDLLKRQLEEKDILIEQFQKSQNQNSILLLKQLQLNMLSILNFNQKKCKQFCLPFMDLQYTNHGHCNFSQSKSNFLISSSLIVLLNIMEFNDYIFKFSYLREFDNSDIDLILKNEILLNYQEILFQFWMGNENEISIKEEIYNSINGFSNKNINEFFENLLITFHMVFNRAKRTKPTKLQIKDKFADSQMSLKTFINENLEWNLLNQSHQSIIVDLFAGQMQEEIQCQQCNSLYSKTIKNFTYIDLPVPQMFCLTIYFIKYSLYISANPHESSSYQMKIWVTDNMSINCLCENIKNVMNIKSNYAIEICLVKEGKIEEILNQNQQVNYLRSCKIINAYEVKARNSNDLRVIINCSYKDKPCSYPRILYLWQSQNVNALEKNVYESFSKFLKPAFSMQINKNSRQTPSYDDFVSLSKKCSIYKLYYQNINNESIELSQHSNNLLNILSEQFIKIKEKDTLIIEMKFSEDLEIQQLLLSQCQVIQKELKFETIEITLNELLTLLNQRLIDSFDTQENINQIFFSNQQILTNNRQCIYCEQQQNKNSQNLYKVINKISKLPKYLIFSFKDNYFKLLKFPIQDVDFFSFLNIDRYLINPEILKRKYDLFAIIIRQVNNETDKNFIYSVIFKNSYDNNWFHYSKNGISQVSQNQLENKANEGGTIVSLFYRQNKFINSKTPCFICFDEEGQLFYTQCCGNSLHQQCNIQSLKSCPICRKLGQPKLTSEIKFYERVYLNYNQQNYF